MVTATNSIVAYVSIALYHLQDGGLLTNNPCAIAVHEARLLWGRSTPIQCIISLGTGRYLPQESDDRGGERGAINSTSLREKLTKVVASATDTECKNSVFFIGGRNVIFMV